jgi:hypothetical protein
MAESFSFIGVIARILMEGGGKREVADKQSDGILAERGTPAPRKAFSPHAEVPVSPRVRGHPKTGRCRGGDKARENCESHLSLEFLRGRERVGEVFTKPGDNAA